jgi:peptide deformylase
MALLEIKKFPDKVLKQKSFPVNDINGQLQSIIDNMIETMYAAPGIGLAAPQIGISQQLFVVDVSTVKENGHPLLVIVNPEIVEIGRKIDSEEGCLSIPDYKAIVRRAEKVCIKGLDREGNTLEIEADGLLARAFQHEIDHINGTLIIDRIGTIRRNFFLKRYRKSLKRKN